MPNSVSKNVCKNGLGHVRMSLSRNTFTKKKIRIKNKMSFSTSSN